jgi:hypothetical protein
MVVAVLPAEYFEHRIVHAELVEQLRARRLGIAAPDVPGLSGQASTRIPALRARGYHSVIRGVRRPLRSCFGRAGALWYLARAARATREITRA